LGRAGEKPSFAPNNFTIKIMNRIKIGDKVRFLNSVGGGVVKALKDKQTGVVGDGVVGGVGGLGGVCATFLLFYYKG